MCNELAEEVTINQFFINKAMTKVDELKATVDVLRKI